MVIMVSVRVSMVSARVSMVAPTSLDSCSCSSPRDTRFACGPVSISIAAAPSSPTSPVDEVWGASVECGCECGV